METIIVEALKQGVLGLTTALAIYVAWRKDRQVEHLYSRWDEKTEKRTEKYHELGKEMVATVAELQRRQAEMTRRIEDLARLLPPRGGDA